MWFDEHQLKNWLTTFVFSCYAGVFVVDGKNRMAGKRHLIIPPRSDPPSRNRTPLLYRKKTIDTKMLKIPVLLSIFSPALYKYKKTFMFIRRLLQYCSKTAWL